MAELSDQSAGSPALATLLAEHAEIERELADPAVHADQARARALGRRYAELTNVVDVAKPNLPNGCRSCCCRATQTTPKTPSSR
jgi:hypothetical protein